MYILGQTTLSQGWVDASNCYWCDKETDVPWIFQANWNLPCTPIFLSQSRTLCQCLVCTSAGPSLPTGLLLWAWCPTHSQCRSPPSVLWDSESIVHSFHQHLLFSIHSPNTWFTCVFYYCFRHPAAPIDSRCSPGWPLTHDPLVPACWILWL